MRVPFSYLDRQFADIEGYLDDVRALVINGDFTLGSALEEFEGRFAELCKVPHAIGVGSGTDALMLSLKALDIGPGDEVITAANTFVATVGAIAMAGARPVFVDNEDGYVLDPDLLERAITPMTKAIIPVHYSGNMVDMARVNEIAERHGLKVVEDACQAIGATIDDRPAGSWGDAGCFSVHPLKNLNVWGDGGIVVTQSDQLADSLRLLRNHGLVNRDEVAVFGHNSRLDALQAVVGNRLFAELPQITTRRIEIGARYDRAFADVEEIGVPRRRPEVKHVFHLYMVRAAERDALLAHLQEGGIEAKIHYPVPVHLQPAARDLRYQAGDFPVCERDAGSMVTLPSHQHLSDAEVEYAIQRVHSFYN